jgi:hypothetical protein
MVGRNQKGEKMDEDMNASELLVELAEENQTRKILAIIKDCESLEEVIQKVEALLDK